MADKKTEKPAQDMESYRHSLAHLLAAAVMELYPDAKRAIGPAIENGFYYDFEFSKPIAEGDLRQIEKKMRSILPSWDKFEVQEVSKEEAKNEFKDNLYKLELIDEFSKDGKKLTLYKSGSYVDLCKGGHVSSAKEIKSDSFKLTHTAGAYWRGSEKNKQLTRIYGLAFSSKKELDDYLKLLEEAKKRDHRVIGQQLSLFSFDETSPGAPFFHPKGAVIFNELLSFLREEYSKRGYEEVITPLIYDKSLWQASGHWEHYNEDMFFTKMDNKEASMKPMNCPGHCIMYRKGFKSYRDLPLRIADFAVLHRNELKGVLGGLTRVRKFQQDDAHLFVTPEQLEGEILGIIDFLNHIYKEVFDFDYSIELSTKPEKSIGSEEAWGKAENALKEALKKKKLDYGINGGEGAFYGPKIDFHIKDVLGRSWQLGTIQVDSNLPERFGLEYEDKDGKRKRPIMIHRALLGSIERFMAILIEHYAGRFPLWLAPEQIRILTVANRFDAHAEKLKKEFEKNNFRTSLDVRAESIGKKVREAQLAKVPLIITIGEKEEQSGNLAIRTLDNKVHFDVRVDDFVGKVRENIQYRKVKVEF